ncbi:MAG: hypothetical protein ABJR46_03460 [Tateyamaria sp.]|uniref:hypothetical protein n=1 Tax=Tateyamaria sp. TaxID=1929288 RepID=UPI00326AC481
MKFEASKTPLLIAAIAAAVTLTSLTQANAATLETGTNATNVQLVDRGFAATGTFDTLGKQKGAPKRSFAKKKTYEPKYSFSRKKVLSRLF